MPKRAGRARPPPSPFVQLRRMTEQAGLRSTLRRPYLHCDYLHVAENLHLLCELLGGRDETQLEQTIELDEALLGAPRFLRLARGGSRQLPEILRMHSDGLVDSSQPHNVALTSGIVCLHPAALAIEL